jgi:hypothetical protein
MIRGDVLHAKTSQVSAQHQREVSSLGRIQERETNARCDVQRREQKFWREVAHAVAAKAQRRGGQEKGAGGNSLARALEAHRLLRDAKAQHEDVSQELRSQVCKVMRTKFAIDTFTAKRKKHQIKCEYRRAERVCEQVDEALTAQRAGRSPERMRSSARWTDEKNDVARVVEDEARVAMQPSPKSVDVPHVADARHSLPMKSADSPIRVADTLSLQSMHYDAQPATSTLTVNVEHRGAPLVCRLAAASTGEVGIVVGTPHGKLSENLERHRSGIMNKLSELGIKFSSLEVRRESGMDNSGGGPLKRGRRNREERDENTIA